jgi:AhpD family alkylhydroperoxidase
MASWQVRSKRPFLDKSEPEVWDAAEAFANSVAKAAAARGLTRAEIELINVRVSQMNECVFCLNLHARRARKAGVAQQHLDALAGWRGTALFSERESAMLAVAEAATRLPLTEDAIADLVAVRNILGDDAFAAAEWVALTINTFNRISVLSGHDVRASSEAEGQQ